MTKNDNLNHVLAFNAFRGGNKGHVESLPLADYDRLLAYPWLHEAIQQIRGEKPILGKRLGGKNGKVTVVEPLEGKALEKAMSRAKSSLPFRCAHYYHFIDNKRRQANIDPRSFLFQTTIDVDEKELVETALERAKELDKSDSPWKGMLLHLEYSARKKLHIDIRMPIGMTIEETQRAYCEALGVPCDESCFSPERIIFITDKASEIYRSPMWYAVLPEDELEVRREAFRKRGLEIDGRKNPNISNSGFIPQVNSTINQPSNIHQPSNFNQPSNPNLNHSINGNKSLQFNGATAEQNMPVAQGAAASQSAPVGQEKQPAVGGNQVPADSAANPVDSNPATGDGGAAPDSNRGDHGSYQMADASTSPSQGLAPAQGLAPSQGMASSPSQKNLIAFDLFCQQAGLSGINIDSEGSRHSSLLAIMSAGASRVMSEEELQKVVAVKMPSFAQERDCQQLIHDFYAKYCDNTKPFSKDVLRINAQAERYVLGVKREEGRVKNPNASQNEFLSQNAASGLEDYPLPPAMPERLPKLIRLLISRTPEIYKPAVANAVFPPLATHLWRTRFRYIDNREHEATMMNVLMAGTGAGKDCISQPIDYIMADIRRRDAENLAREKAWKDESSRKGANKDKRQRPENLIIQEIDADMTNPAFVMRTAEAQGHFLYTKLNEIDQFDALRGQGNQQFRIMCLAFDPFNQYGQTRVGMQSVTERVTIRFNWNACTTIQKGQRYFSKVLTDGPISRINFCTIPEREIGAEMPVYGEYGADFAEQLRPYIDNLCRATGLVECKEAYDLAKKLKDENADFARMSQSRIFENLSFRANVIAYLKACVLYVANGMVWEKEIEDFIRWSEQYDLYCKMRFFGDAIAKQEEAGEKSSRRGPSNLLQLLPDEFTFQMAESVRLENGLDRKGTKGMVNTWVHRKYIERRVQGSNGNAVKGNAGNGSNDNYSNDSFIKLKFRKNA